MLSAAPARAANLQAQERSARKACLNGDYSKGVSILSDLFLDTRNPTYLFNQGRCFEQNGRYEEAIVRFDEYLRLPNATDTTSAEKHIADCKKKLGQEQGPSSLQPSPQPTVLPVPAPAATPVPVEAPPAVVEQPTVQAAEGHRRWGLVTAGIVSAIVGAGAAATGLVFNVKANKIVSDYESKTGSYSESKTKDHDNYRTYGWIGYGVGAACAVTGAILIAVGASKTSPSSAGDVALLPTLGNGQFGASLTGEF